MIHLPPPPITYLVNVAQDQKFGAIHRSFIEPGKSHYNGGKKGLKIHKWDQEKQILYYLQEGNSKVFAISIANIYITNFDKLREPLFVDISQIAVDPNVLRSRILREGLGFVKCTVDEKWNIDDLQDMAVAYNEKKGFWEDHFISKFASSATSKKLQSTIAAINNLNFEHTSETTSNKRIWNVYKELASLKKENKTLKDKLAGIELNNQRSSFRTWFEKYANNYISTFAVIGSYLSIILLGLRNRKIDQRSSALEKANLAKEESERKLQKENSIKVENQNIIARLELELKVMELQNKVKALQDAMNQSNKLKMNPRWANPINGDRFSGLNYQ